MLLSPKRGLAFPGPQAVQASAARLPRSLLNVPGEHGVNASAREPADALGQYPPTGQSSQDVALYTAEYEPAEHERHEACPVLG